MTDRRCARQLTVENPYNAALSSFQPEATYRWFEGLAELESLVPAPAGACSDKQLTHCAKRLHGDTVRPRLREPQRVRY